MQTFVFGKEEAAGRYSREEEQGSVLAAERGKGAHDQTSEAGRVKQPDETDFAWHSEMCIGRPALFVSTQ